MVKSDLAEFIDDDDGIGERRVLQQAIEQRGLAGTEKTGEHSKRNWFGRSLQPRGGCSHFFSDVSETFGVGFGGVALATDFSDAFFSAGFLSETIWVVDL